MTGLILKDLLVMRKALKSYLLIVAIYAVLAFMDILQFGFIFSFTSIVLMTLPLSAFAYDEQAKWDRYAFSLPIGRGAVVRARYLFVLFLALAAFAVGIAATAAMSLAGLEEPVELILTLLVSTAICLLIPAIILPLCYKLGPERARPYLYAIIFIPTILVVLLAKIDAIDFSALNRLDALSPAVLIGGAALLPAAGLAVLFVSYLISCRVAADKEY